MGFYFGRTDGLKLGSTLNPRQWLLKEITEETWEQKVGDGGARTDLPK